MQLHVGKRLKLRWSTTVKKAGINSDGKDVYRAAPPAGTVTAIGVAGSFRVTFDSPPGRKTGQPRRFWYNAEQFSGFEAV